jgi:hypothetical protein
MTARLRDGIDLDREVVDGLRELAAARGVPFTLAGEAGG